jgi:hypothetical protein
MNRRFSLFVILLCTLCLSALPLVAQQGTGSITGHVTDPSGAAIAGAQITAVNAATQVRSASTTNSAGIYLLPNLIPGTYSLEATAANFKKALHPNVLVQVSDNIGLDFALQVGSFNETVTVTAQPSQLRTEDAQIGEVVNEQLIETLVNPSRNPLQLITVAGNVQGSGAPAGASLGLNGGFNNGVNDTRINGGRESGVEYLVDGVPATGGFAHQVVNTSPNTEDVQEFKVITNGMSAEYGRVSGGVVEVSTKSGQNALHGQLFEYHQDQFFNANGWSQDNLCAYGKATGGSTSSCTKALYHNNDFGFAVGGPVLIPHIYNGRNKTFFFANSEWTRYTTPGGEGITTTITEAERNSIPDPFNGMTIKNPVPCPVGTQYAAAFPNPTGDCADLTDIGYPASNPLSATYPQVALGDIYIPANSVTGARTPAGGDAMHIPVSELSLPALHYISLMPHANIPAVYGTTGWNYAYHSPSKANTVKWDVRVDHVINDKQRIYGRYTHDTENSTSLSAFPNFANSGNHLDGGFGATLHYDYVISPTLILDLNTGGNYSPARFGGSISGQGASTAGWGFQPSVTDLMGTTLLGIHQVRDEATAPSGGGDVIGNYLNGPGFNGIYTTNFMYSAAITKILNRHTMKFGYEARRYYDNFINPAGSGPVGDGFYITGAGSFLNTNDDGNIWGNPQDDANNMATFMWGLDSWSHATTAVTRSLASNYYAAYLQDDYKVTKKLTVNVGARWEMQTPVTDRNNNLTVWDPLAPPPFTLNPSYNFNNALLGATCTPNGSLNQTTCSPVTQGMTVGITPPDWATTGAFDPGAIVFVNSPEHRSREATISHPWNFSPRIGFAYQVMPKTVLRGSFGVFFIPLGNNLTNYGDTPNVAYATMGSTEFGNNSINYEQGPGFQTIANAFPLPALELQVFGHNSQIANMQTASSGSGSGGVDINSHMPHEMDWSFGIQRQLPHNWLVEVTYSANHSGDLLGTLYPSHFPKSLYNGGWQGTNFQLFGYNNGPNGNQANYYAQSPFAGQFPAGGFTGGNPGILDVNGQPEVPLGALMYQYPYFGPVNVENANIGRSNFQSGNLRVEKRLSEGLQILLNYTYSKALDDVGGPDINAQPSQIGLGSLSKTFQSVDGSIQHVYGFSPGDQTHRLVVTYNYQLPFGHGRRWMNSQSGVAGGVIEAGLGGWEITGDSTWNSGNPVSLSVNNSNVDNFDDIWYTNGSLAPGASLSSLKGSGYGNPGSTLCDIFCSSALTTGNTHAAGINKSSLAVGEYPYQTSPPASQAGQTSPFTYGNLPPILGFIRQPSSWGTDIAVLKRFPIYEKTYFQLRLEGQNIFNHPTLGGYDTNTSDPTFGLITGKGGSRVIVISGRYVF